MTNIESRIIWHPPIHLADITPLERLVLTNVLEFSETEAGTVVSSSHLFFGLPRSSMISSISPR
ncbi:hypothetical protein GGE12_001383 [Rhizobium mongolense]|uniref:Uncharacterized protein n=1 Tax=Rhizobium mongolense TaxID=57676 RepID=A0A7W6RJX4_9HYPH|nr:hypothetical protein [Rhizobium mongolense]